MITNGTQLKNRILWFDGSTSIDPSNIYNYLKYDNIFVTELTSDIKQYNKISDNKITVKDVVSLPDVKWEIPEEYISLNIEDYIIQKHLNYMKLVRNSRPYEQRLAYELVKYNKNNLYDMLRCLVYIIDTLTEKNVTWGIGRGSSVASYVLFLLDVHIIDPIECELDFMEFMN